MRAGPTTVGRGAGRWQGNYAAVMSTEIERACPLPIPKLPLAELTPDMEARIAGGSDPRVVRTLGQAGDAYHLWGAFYTKLLHQGALPLRTKEVARLRIAALNSCHY